MRKAIVAVYDLYSDSMHKAELTFPITEVPPTWGQLNTAYCKQAEGLGMDDVFGSRIDDENKHALPGSWRQGVYGEDRFILYYAGDAWVKSDDILFEQAVDWLSTQS